MSKAYLELTPIPHPDGTHLMGHLSASYADIVAELGEEHERMSPDSKSEACWIFKDQDDRIAAIWCWKVSKLVCRSWSVWGDAELLLDIFGADNVTWGR